LRRAIATVEWSHLALMIGQEKSLVSVRNPRSLASVGVPDFTLAGNLWFWLPQVRVGAHYGDTIDCPCKERCSRRSPARLRDPSTRNRLRGALGRPYLQGRVALGWGPSDDPSEIGVGGHVGWLRGLDSLSGDSLLPSARSRSTRASSSDRRS